MIASPLGRTLLIANPAAASGQGRAAAEHAARFLSAYGTDELVQRFTERSGHAQEIAAGSAGFDSVVALGGDGAIHEAVCGLMRVDASERPALGIIPFGTGNDFARTIRMARNDVEGALGMLVRGRRKPLDLGRVNGVWFAQTLSFGLDAAIALDTTARRAEGDGMKGTGLFVSSAVKVLAKASSGWKCRASFDGEEVELDEIVLAVQNGPTYGAGFRICPDARPDDGLLDVCYNLRIPSVPRTLALLGRARFGKHTGSKLLAFRKARRAVLDFSEQPPAQVDGELIEGTHFEIEVVPQALEVIVPAE